MVGQGSETALAMAPLTAAEKRDAYLNALLATVQGAALPGLGLPSLRSAAEALVKEHSFPSTRDEAWRFTDISAMLEIPFTAAQGATVTETDLAAIALAETPGARLVFVNGCYAAHLSDTTSLPAGVVIGSLAELSQRPNLADNLLGMVAQRLGQQSGGHEVFTALNTVGFADVAVVWVPAQQVVSTPIQVIQVSVPQAEPAIAQPRCLIVAEAGSTLTLVEDFWGMGAGHHFTNAVSELWLGDGAQITHVRVQREGSNTFHIAKTAVTQGRESSYQEISVALGAQLSRHTLEVYQAGEQTATRLYGLGAIAHRQLADTHSLVALAYPHGTVEQVQKFIVDDAAHSVFSGIISVPHNAQLTHASQLNRNLLLSDQGRVDTKPQLDIVADNVKCSHGATVSQLSADEVFYLQSRGIHADQAQRLLIYAFAMEVIDRIPLPSLQTALTGFIKNWRA